MRTSFSTKSHLIRLTELQKRKARRRLVGSILLLVIALVVLLRITSNIEQIQVQAPKIEIKNTASEPIQKSITSAPIASNVINASSNTANIASATITNTILPASAAIASTTITTKQTASSTIVNLIASSPFSMLKPRVVTDTVKPKLTPEDILNGVVAKQAPTRYYVQLLGSSNKQQILSLQSQLKQKNITTNLQTVDTPTGKVYRLRIGPFSSSESANTELNSIKELM